MIDSVHVLDKTRTQGVGRDGTAAQHEYPRNFPKSLSQFLGASAPVVVIS